MLKVEQIIKEDHPILRKIADQVQIPPNKEDKYILEEMLELVKNSQDPELAKKYNLEPSVGIAAPQIGVSKRMIVAHVTDTVGILHSYALFNPEIIYKSEDFIYLPKGEGCLSVDREIPGYVPRHKEVTVTAINLEGNKVHLNLTGIVSIVIQHEIDHLNGVMFYDHINQENPFSIPKNSSEYIA